MAKSGFVKLHRQITEHWLWNGEPFDKAHAWIDLLLMANWKTTKRMFNGGIITQERGQVVCSINGLAERWGWSPNKVRRFLKVLAAEGMVHTDGSTYGTTITIEKYAFFQDERRADGTADGRADGTQQKKKEEIKEIKKGQGTAACEAVPMPEDFKAKLDTMFSWRKDN